MKIYDISQEVFSCCIYPGDPAPEKRILSSVSDGAPCNLTWFSMCAHNGTHIDSPYHFLCDGKTVDAIPLEKTVGLAYVSEQIGDISSDDAHDILRKAKKYSCEAAKRILIKGKAVVTEGAAVVFAESGVVLLGNESQTIGPENAPAAVHKILLGADVVLLEGIRLSEVIEGAFFLASAPICLAGSDGSPCRSILIDFENGDILKK